MCKGEEKHFYLDIFLEFSSIHIPIISDYIHFTPEIKQINNMIDTNYQL